jgi:signal transduction histidine kinase
VPEDQLNTLGQRGVRLDEQKQGSGLGLAIARDVTEAYQGSLSMHRSPMGGLAVNVQIPGLQ